MMPSVFMGFIVSCLAIMQLFWQGLTLNGAHHILVVQSQTQEPVVGAVLFWMEGCPNCTEILEGFLPKVQSQFGNRLEIRLIELVTAEDVERLFQVGSAYGLSREKTGVPLLLLGNQALVGAEDISAGMVDLVEEYLRQGGVDFPNLENLPTANLPPAERNPTSSEQQVSNGMTLAAIIMVGMLASLVLTGWIVARAFGGRSVPPALGRFDGVIPVLSLIGMGVAIYLTVIEATSIPAICGPIGDCNTVQQSPYAKIFGVVPVGLLGIVGYLAILGAWLWGKFVSGKLGSYMPLAIFGMGVFGTLYSVYLTYLELFVIKAVCIWCLSSAVIMTLIMLASLPAASQWLAAAEEEEQ